MYFPIEINLPWEALLIRKFDFNKKYLSISLYVIFVLLCYVIIEKTIGNINIIAEEISSLFKLVTGILASFVYGFFIAFLLNSVVRTFEFKIFDRLSFLNKRAALRRAAAVSLTFIIFIGGIIWIIAYLVPEIITSVTNLVNSIRNYDYSNLSIPADFLYDLNELFATNYSVNDLITQILNSPIFASISNIPDMLNKLLTGTFSFATEILKFALGLIIAFYMLCDKEIFAKAFSRLLFVFFNRGTALKIIDTAKDSNKVFESFFMGKAIDSLIIGIMFFIICMVAEMPYPVLLSIIVGVTNMIPYFGPFIGAVPVVIIVLLIAPVKAAIIAVLIFILQQFDGIILGPKILGDSTGTRPIEVIFAITVGGALFGFLGMFLGVPVFAVIKTMLNHLLDKQYNKKYRLPVEDPPKEV